MQEQTVVQSLPPLILASTSVYRQALLQRLGLEFTCVGPAVDENEVKTRGAAPDQLALVLAEQKASAVAEQHPQAVVLAGDQVASCAGRILDKPGNRAAALEQLQFLRGREHALFTAYCLIYGPTVLCELDHTRLWMRTLDDAALARYVDREQPFDCAGSYKIESAGIVLFERIETADFTAITGLPLLAVSRHLRNWGFLLP